VPNKVEGHLRKRGRETNGDEVDPRNLRASQIDSENGIILLLGSASSLEVSKTVSTVFNMFCTCTSGDTYYVQIAEKNLQRNCFPQHKRLTGQVVRTEFACRASSPMNYSPLIPQIHSGAEAFPRSSLFQIMS
jgi:hypothetical protein